MRLKSPADVVGAVPFLIGFHPADSLVVVGLSGPGGRTGMSSRADLPPPDDHHNYASQYAAQVAQAEPDSVILVCYTEQPDDDGRLPAADVIEFMIDELSLREIGCTEALLVRHGRWWSYTCTKPCCPRDGTPLPATPSAEVAALEARRALEGAAVLPDREALAKSVQGPVALRRIALEQRFDEIEERLMEEVIERGIEAVSAETLSLAQRLRERFSDDPNQLDDADAVRLILGLEDKLTRDVLITWGLDDHREELLAFLTVLVQCAVDHHAPPICTVLGAVAYQHGNGALAGVALARALRLNPDYEMAQILDAMLANHVHPREIRTMTRRVRRQLAVPPAREDGMAA